MDVVWIVLKNLVSINDAKVFFWLLANMDTTRVVEVSRAEINERVLNGTATTSNVVAIIDRLCELGLVERIPVGPGQPNRYWVLVATKKEVLEWQAGRKG